MVLCVWEEKEEGEKEQAGWVGAALVYTLLPPR